MDDKYKQDLSQRIEGERHAGIVIKDRQILIMHRIKNGHEYYVIPGGHRRDGELGSDTVKREMYEETGITIKSSQLAFEFVDHLKSNHDYYYLCEWENGDKPTLMGEEKDADPKINFFEPMWLPIAEIKNLNLLPPCAKSWITCNIS